MRIAFTTLGCKINQYETDAMRKAAAAEGNSIVPFESEADVYVINTCSVTSKSDYQCRQVIRKAIQNKPEGGRVVVAGSNLQGAAGYDVTRDGSHAVVATEPPAVVPHEAPLHIVSGKVFASLSDTEEPQGLLALVEPPAWRIEDMRAGPVLVLDGAVGVADRPVERAVQQFLEMGKVAFYKTLVVVPDRGQAARRQRRLRCWRRRDRRRARSPRSPDAGRRHRTPGRGIESPAPVAPAPVSAAALPSFKILSIKADQSITLRAYNFPANVDFTVRMDQAGNLAIDGIVVKEFNSGNGGSFDATYAIPGELKGKKTIAIRFESSKGYYTYDWFNNKPKMATVQATGDRDPVQVECAKSIIQEQIDRLAPVTFPPAKFIPQDDRKVSRSPGIKVLLARRGTPNSKCTYGVSTFVRLSNDTP